MQSNHRGPHTTEPNGNGATALSSPTTEWGTTRRRVLLTVGTSIASVAGVRSTQATQTTGGDEQWHFEAGRDIFSSPTVADGTAYVGSNDSNLYAVNAGIDGSSTGSRVRLGTLGHLGFPLSGGSASNSDDGLPGFGVPGALTALGGAAYLLNSRRTDE